MMCLRSIRWINDRDYEVDFVADGRHLSMVCSVSEDDGVRFVRPRPDLMTEIGVAPRLIAAAVLAFDDVALACRAIDPPPS